MTHPNYNPETSTHYGCIRLNDLDIDLVEAIYDLAPPDSIFDETHLEGITATIDDVTFEVFDLVGAYHLLIIDSKFIDYTRPCSPCVPNAGDLTSPDPQGIKTYSVPPTWF